MKKSEMIELLENLLQTIPVSDNGSYYQDAETILEFIENKGMRPPNVCTRTDGSWDDNKFTGHFYMDKDMYYWEDE